jgi:chromosome segregation protein
MHLKRLELTGFKSFASRTVFEMSSGITAIVGPNGAGKSNVADGVRWVLGEQSGKHLRTKKLEDVIFAGSSGRASVGMAEVTITLDNEERWLPVDVSEVVVTRRAFRSGESEYLINHSRVRLRDILELFMRANLGQNSYAILGQGAVDTVLNLRPDERRGLIEEAAGVRHYRLKLDEAGERLRATRDNLARVSLLLNEIKPRLAHLEKQARRAEEHQRLSLELSQALKAWYGQMWQKNQDLLAASRAAYDQKREEYNQAQASVDGVEGRAAATRKRLEKVRSRITGLEKERHELLADINRLDQTVTFDEERVALMAQRRDELAAEIAALEQEQMGEPGIDAALEPLKELEKNARAARKHLGERQSALTDIEQEFVALRGAAVESQERSARARSAGREVERQLQRLKENETRLTRELTRMSDRKDALSLELRTVAAEFRRLKTKDQELATKLDDLLSQQRAVQRMVIEAREMLLESDNGLQDVIHQLSEHQSRFDVLSELQNERLGLSAEVSQLLAGAIQESGDIAGETQFGTILGVVGRLLQVPAGLERAIEAALAENMQTVVMASQEDAFGAVRILTEREAGRLSVIPLDTLRPVYPLNLHNERGVVGVAARLVRPEPRFKALFDTLLGRTIVVEDLEVARRMIQRGLGSVVTLEGTLLRPYGEVVGGVTPQDTSTFSWEGQLNELPARIASLEARRAELENQLKSRRNVVGSNEAAVTTLAQRVERMRSERSSAQDELAQVRNKVGQLRGEISWLVIAEKNSAHELESLTRERADLRKERERLKQEVSLAEASVDGQQGANETVARRRDELIRAVGEASRELAALEGERKSLVAVQAAQQRAQERIGGQIEARRRNSEQLVQEAATIARRLEENRAALGGSRQRVQEVEKELVPGRDEVIRQDEQDRALQEELAASRAALLISERECLEAESHVQRCADELGALRNRLDADGMAVNRSGEIVAIGSEDVYESWTPRHAGAGELPPISGAAEVDLDLLQDRIQKLRSEVRGIGPVNFEAQTDYAESQERNDFLSEQVTDMEEAEKSLLGAIAELEQTIDSSFQDTFTRVNNSFAANFKSFFGGGEAKLVATATDRPDGGVDIVAQVPGRRLSSLTVLSGGERALTATALLFALLEANPAPFCVLDEVDAALDEANVVRFTKALSALGKKTQFIIITHNRGSIEKADTIYGLSMGDDQSSKVLSLRLADLPAGSDN